MAQSISDEELQLKKRARRRLVGAVALVLLAVVFLPMVLDKEPKPVGQDIAIRIPSQENTPFKPQAAAPKVIPAVPVEPLKAVESQTVAPEAAKQQTDKAAASGEPQPGKVSADKPAAEQQAGAKSTATLHMEIQQKPATPSAEKPAKHATEAKRETTAKSQGYVILLGAFANADNAKQRQAKLNALGVRFYTEKVKTPSGEKLRVRAGPYATREEAEKVLGRLKSQGITDGVVAEKNS